MTQWDGNAFDDGFRSYLNGWAIHLNPYNLASDDFLHDSWEEGWIAASKAHRARR